MTLTIKDLPLDIYPLIFDHLDVDSLKAVFGIDKWFARKVNSYLPAHFPLLRHYQDVVSYLKAPDHPKLAHSNVLWFEGKTVKVLKIPQLTDNLLLFASQPPVPIPSFRENHLPRALLDIQPNGLICFRQTAKEAIEEKYGRKPREACPPPQEFAKFINWLHRNKVSK